MPEIVNNSLCGNESSQNQKPKVIYPFFKRHKPQLSQNIVPKKKKQIGKRKLNKKPVFPSSSASIKKFFSPRNEGHMTTSRCYGTKNENHVPPKCETFYALIPAQLIKGQTNLLIGTHKIKKPPGSDKNDGVDDIKRSEDEENIPTMSSKPEPLVHNIFLTLPQNMGIGCQNFVSHNGERHNDGSAQTDKQDNVLPCSSTPATQIHHLSLPPPQNMGIGCQNFILQNEERQDQGLVELEKLTVHTTGYLPKNRSGGHLRFVYLNPHCFNSTNTVKVNQFKKYCAEWDVNAVFMAGALTRWHTREKHKMKCTFRSISSQLLLATSDSNLRTTSKSNFLPGGTAAIFLDPLAG